MNIDNATPDVESSEDDLNTQLRKAFEEAEAKQAEPEKEPEQPRADDGKFVAPAEPEPVIEKPKLAAPKSWKPEIGEKWNDLPEDVQQYIVAREEEVHKGFTKFDEERSFGKKLKDVITPYMAMIQAEGGSPETAVNNLLTTAYTLRTADPQTKAQLFSALAQQYGVDLASVADVPQMDPTILALRQEIESLKQGVNGYQMQTQQQQEAALQNQILEFSKDKPHFETLKPMMGALLSNGQAEDLQQAYEMAKWANPQVRESLIREQAQTAQAKAAEEAKARVDAAKAKAVSVAGAPGSNTASADIPAVSLREELERQFRQRQAI